MLLMDRSDPSRGTIVTPELIRLYRMHRYFLQQAHGMVELREAKAGSLFIFEAQVPSDVSQRWDMVDFVGAIAAGVRVGRVAVIGALADGGRTRRRRRIL
jgi:hypothetical protein